MESEGAVVAIVGAYSSSAQKQPITLVVATLPLLMPQYMPKVQADSACPEVWFYNRVGMAKSVQSDRLGGTKDI